MRIAVSVGHGLDDPGAGSTWCEHLEAYKVAWFLRDALKRAGHDVIPISCFQSLSQKIRAVNDAHLVQPIDLAIEIHFNSAESSAANGTEVLHYGAAQAPLSARISAAISKAIGTRDRGAQRRPSLGWLTKTRPPALIIEVLFINNPAETQRMSDPRFHRIVAQAIASSLDVNP